MNNAAYVKTMENMRKTIKVRIVKNEKDIIKYTPKSRYINHKMHDGNLTPIHGKKYSQLLTNLHMLDLQYQK